MQEAVFDFDRVIFKHGVIPISGAIRCLRALHKQGVFLSVLTDRKGFLLSVAKFTLWLFRLGFMQVHSSNGESKADVLKRMGGCLIFLDDQLKALREVYEENSAVYVFQACFFDQNVEEDTLWEKAHSWPDFHIAVLDILKSAA